jgi:hypothetical protein
MNKTILFLRKNHLLSKIEELKNFINERGESHKSLECFSYRFYSRELKVLEELSVNL